MRKVNKSFLKDYFKIFVSFFFFNTIDLSNRRLIFFLRQPLRAIARSFLV